jgi:hypothetical protein
MTKRKPPRKKAPVKKTTKKTFTITVEAQPVVVCYEPNAYYDMAHFEYRSPHQPPRRIPYSDTGYFSHFVSMDRLKGVKDVPAFARNQLLAFVRYESKSYDKRAVELPLF